MGWHAENEREQRGERDFKRRPWRERHIIQRTYWAAALLILFALSSARNTAESHMVDVTYFVALPFAVGSDGPEPREAVECTRANAAIMRAERLARIEGHIGAVAFTVLVI